MCDYLQTMPIELTTLVDVTVGATPFCNIDFPFLSLSPPKIAFVIFSPYRSDKSPHYTSFCCVVVKSLLKGLHQKAIAATQLTAHTHVSH